MARADVAEVANHALPRQNAVGKNGLIQHVGSGRVYQALLRCSLRHLPLGFILLHAQHRALLVGGAQRPPVLRLRHQPCG